MEISKCKWCSKILDDEFYIFCGLECQQRYIFFVESKVKKMNHPFSSSQLDKTKCASCSRDYMSHTKMAKCESCNNTGECNIFDNILMCVSCENEYQQNLKNVVKTVEDNVSNILARSRELDQKIITSADIFNAQTISNNDIRLAIESDTSIPNKTQEYQRVIMERVEHLQNAIFSKDSEIHKLSVEKLELENKALACIKDLRALGNDLRSEYREKLRISDVNYAPIKPAAAPRVKKVTKDPFERMVEAYQVAQAQKNILISLDEARKILTENMKGLK